MKLLNVFLILVLLAACEQAPDQPAELTPVSIAIGMQPSATLAFVARDQGYFAEAGLDVTLLPYVSGKVAIRDALEPGLTEYALAADTPFVDLCVRNPEYVALASIYHSNNINRIVARRDHGINSAEDLEGKRIGTQQNSAVHFFLYSVLQHLGLKEYEKTFFKAVDLPSALASGEIDAFSMREPFVSDAVALLGDNAVVLSFPGVMTQNELLIAHREQFDATTATRLLQALVQAEDYAERNLEQALEIAHEYLGGDPVLISSALKEVNLEVTLSQSLYAGWEQRERWMRSKQGEAPDIDFRRHIESGPLKEQSPLRVTVL